MSPRTADLALPRPDDALVVAAMLDRDHPVKREVADWALEAIDPGDMIERDRDCVFFREGWKACAEAGLLGTLVPAAAGGNDLDVVTAALQLEGLGLGSRDNGLAYGIASQVLSFQQAILRFGSAAQRDAILAPACRGELFGAFAITEPESGSDTYAMQTRAQRTDDGWALHGTKAHITLAPVADVAVVFAITDPDVGRWGISAFVVHRDRPGVEFGPIRPKMGLRTTPYGDITLDGYVAGPDDLLGAEGAGVSIFSACMESERALIMAAHLGAAERLIDQAVERANTRHQFGRPIANFQAVSHRLVDVYLRHEAARLHVYKAAAAFATGRRSTLAAALAKLASSEAIAAIGLDAARVHGALGYLEEHEVEREVRDALGSLVYAGTSDVQKNLIASLLGIAQRKD